MSEVIRHTNFSVSNLSYSKPSNQQNVYYGAINYKDDKPCYIQSTKLVVKEIKEENKQTFMIVSVDLNDFSFYDLLVKLDDHNLSSTYQLSKDWFNKELPMDILENMYRRITKPFMKDELPEIQLKIPMNKQKSICSIYDSSNNSIDIEQVKEGSVIVCILHIKGLKFLKKDYYCDNYISQIKLCETSNYLIPTKCLIDFEDQKSLINDPKYDYEILDEEVILLSKEKTELEEKYKQLEIKITGDQQNLIELKKKIDNLN
tara:strand:+ start:109 stop:888 length:780 start_codon:yes stop_codon:yes gene_type:complete